MKIIVLGANGSLGSHVTRLALLAGHTVTADVRDPTKLALAGQPKLSVRQADLSTIALPELSEMLRGHDALINTAGFVTDGEKFIAIVTAVVEAVEALRPQERPVCWFIAGAGLLDLDNKARRGLDLPKVRDTYWPHAKNHARLQQSELDWRMLCPGPMVESQPVGIERLRTSTETIAVTMPTWVGQLPSLLLLVLFTRRMPEMIVSYTDAAALMLENLAPGGKFSKKRVGLALPLGMRGTKSEWVALKDK